MAGLADIQKELARRKVQDALAARQAPATQAPQGIPAGDPAKGAQGIPGVVVPPGQRPASAFMDPLPAAVERAAPGTGQMVGRGTFEAAGGTAGTVIGAGTGFMGGGPPTALAGGFAGSILGSAGGSALYDAANDLVRWVYGLEQPSQGFARFAEVFNNATSAGAFDAFTAAILPMIAPVAKALPRFITGVGSKDAGRVANAQMHGLEPTARMIGGRAGAFSSATSRLPFAGTSRDVQRMTKQIDDLLAHTADSLGPALSRDEAANMLALGGRQNALKVMGHIDNLYRSARAASKKLGDPAAFPGDELAVAGEEYLARLGEAAVVVGKKVNLNELVTAKKPATFLAGVARLRGTNLTLPQIDKLRATARRLQAAAGPSVPGGPAKDPDAFHALGQFRGAIQKSQDAATVPELAEALQRANTQYAQWKQFINQPAFSEFRAAVPGVANRTVLNRPRSKEVQEVLDMLAREQSPAVLEATRTLVGDAAFGTIRRRALMDAMSRSVAPTAEGSLRLNVQAMRENLGLTTPDGLERLGTLLKGSDVTVRDVQRFTDALETVGDQFMPEVSQFMLRNLMLRTAGTGARGGVHGLLGSMLAAGAGGAAAATGGLGMLLQGTLGTLVPLRLFNEALASRRVLNWLVRGMEEYRAQGPWQHSFRRAMQIMERNERESHQQEQADAPRVVN